MPEAALLFQDVRKRFGRTEALRGLSLEVPRGSLFGLVGPNGAGKTTAFSIACGFLGPDAGTLSLLGIPGATPAALKGRVSAMPQDAALGRELRCLELLVFLARLQGMSPWKARTEAERVLEEVGLTDRRQAKTKTLSHGMLRRLAIAQALLGEPELVLLDEPTNGLDPRHAAELRDLLRRRRAGRTIVVSSHNLPELESLCDHVAFVDRGVVVAAGPIDVVTGKGEEIEIDLAEGPVPVDALRGVLAGETVRWDEERRVLAVRFQPFEGRQAEDVIAVTLQALLAQGARVSGVRKGRSLERRFLELT